MRDLSQERHFRNLLTGRHCINEQLALCQKTYSKRRARKPRGRVGQAGSGALSVSFTPSPAPCPRRGGGGGAAAPRASAGPTAAPGGRPAAERRPRWPRGCRQKMAAGGPRTAPGEHEGTQRFPARSLAPAFVGYMGPAGVPQVLRGSEWLQGGGQPRGMQCMKSCSLVCAGRKFLTRKDKESIFTMDHFPLWYRRAAEHPPGSFIYSIVSEDDAGNLSLNTRGEKKKGFSRIASNA